MAHSCPKHKVTVAGEGCPICRAEKLKAKDPDCKTCDARSNSVNTMTCAECITATSRIHHLETPKEIGYVGKNKKVVKKTP